MIPRRQFGSLNHHQSAKSVVPNADIQILLPLSGRSGHERTRCFPAPVLNDPERRIAGSVTAMRMLYSLLMLKCRSERAIKHAVMPP